MPDLREIIPPLFVVLLWAPVSAVILVAVVEIISPHGLDNFTVQAACAWTTTWFA